MKGSKPPVVSKIVEIDDARPVTQNAKSCLPPAPAQDLSANPEPQLITDKSFIPAVVSSGHTPLSAAFKYIEPTWRNYIMFVDAEARAGNEDAGRYLEVWSGLMPYERASHFPEQICTLAKVKAEDLIAWVSRQTFVMNTAKKHMALAFLSGDVIEKTAQYAMESPDNYKDRELFLKAAGALPQATNGRTVNFLNAPTVSSNSVALSGSRSESSPVDKSGLKDMDSEIVDLSKIMQNSTDAVVTRAEQEPDDEEDEDEDDDDE